MPGFSDAYINAVRKYLPQPFTIAVLLTILTFLLAAFLTNPSEGTSELPFLAESWYEGLTNGAYLTFTLQMVLILVLGHILAKSGPFNKVVSRLVSFSKNTARSAALVTFFTLIVSWINWGLGLIFGAILARKVAEYASKNDINLNYPLVGAAGYSGLMIWHGGLSGSAPLVVATPGHFLSDTIGIVSTDSTVFSSMNLTAAVAIMVILPTVMYLLGRRTNEESVILPELKSENSHENIHGVGIDRSRWMSLLFGGAICIFALYLALIKPDSFGLEFLNLNFIILSLFGLSIMLHPGFTAFINASNEAINGAAGIVVQFPLYFGILGIMKGSGLIEIFSNYLIEFSSVIPLEINIFISAALVNIFVPSGGGQWAVQGPIIVEAAGEYGLPFSKAIMALAYGDQLTNMLQPFWALPLLAITGLKAKDILPYTFILFLIGLIVYISVLLLF